LEVEMRKIVALLAVGGLLALMLGCNGGSEATVQPTTSAGPTEELEPSAGCLAVPPEVSDSDYVRGEADAPITIIEYSDFQ
jgi:hypothetical protein